jgi:DNA/RNA-binding domain of Phe-tRNA-synthetase-like protein
METSHITFDFTPSLKNYGLRGVYLIISGLKNSETNPDFEKYQQEIVENLLATINPQSIQNDPILKGYRDIHTAFGFSNRNFPGASETLLENLLKYRHLNHINLVVDIYNLISLETRLALGAHDLAHVNGNIHLKPMTGQEGFWPLGSPEPKSTRPGGYSYIDDNNDVLCMLDSRQVEKTKVTLETTDCFYIIQGNSVTSEESIFRCAEKLVQLTSNYCGGKSRILYP